MPAMKTGRRGKQRCGGEGDETSQQASLYTWARISKGEKGLTCGEPPQRTGLYQASEKDIITNWKAKWTPVSLGNNNNNNNHIAHAVLFLSNSAKTKGKQKLLLFPWPQPPHIHKLSFFQDTRRFSMHQPNKSMALWCEKRLQDQHPRELIHSLHPWTLQHYFNKHCKYFSQPPKLSTSSDFYWFNFPLRLRYVIVQNPTRDATKIIALFK